MSNKLQNQAKKRVQAKMAFYVSAIVFGFVSIIMLMLGWYMPSVSFWLSIPILAFIMVLAILYVNAFGLPFTDYRTANWEDEEIQREMDRMLEAYKASKSPNNQHTSSDHLELKELDQLKNKADFNEN